MNIPKHLKKVKDVNWTKEQLEQFELDCKAEWETGSVLGPVHLSKGNEEQLIEIFQYVHPQDMCIPHGETIIMVTTWYFKGMVDGRGKRVVVENY